MGLMCYQHIHLPHRPHHELIYHQLLKIKDEKLIIQYIRNIEDNLVVLQ